MISPRSSTTPCGCCAASIRTLSHAGISAAQLVSPRPRHYAPVDKLEQRGLSRGIGPPTIGASSALGFTEAGIALLNELRDPIVNATPQLGHLSQKELKDLMLCFVPPATARRCLQQLQ